MTFQNKEGYRKFFKSGKDAKKPLENGKRGQKEKEIGSFWKEKKCCVK